MEGGTCPFFPPSNSIFPLPHFFIYISIYISLPLALCSFFYLYFSFARAECHRIPASPSPFPLSLSIAWRTRTSIRYQPARERERTVYTKCIGIKRDGEGQVVTYTLTAASSRATSSAGVRTLAFVCVSATGPRVRGLRRRDVRGRDRGGLEGGQRARGRCATPGRLEREGERGEMLPLQTGARAARV